MAQSRSEVVQAKVTAGVLLNIEVTKVWVGKTTGSQCYGCDHAIAPSEIEVEVELAGSLVLRLHQVCFGIWQAHVGTLHLGVPQTAE